MPCVTIRIIFILQKLLSWARATRSTAVIPGTGGGRVNDRAIREGGRYGGGGEGEGVGHNVSRRPNGPDADRHYIIVCAQHKNEFHVSLVNLIYLELINYLPGSNNFSRAHNTHAHTLARTRARNTPVGSRPRGGQTINLHFFSPSYRVFTRTNGTLCGISWFSIATDLSISEHKAETQLWTGR